MIQVDRLDRVDLATLQLTADLQTRLDRKYIVEPALVDQVIDELHAGLAALEISGARDFGYESVYFDTAGLDSYLGSAHGRRRRFKVRTRSYLDSGDCVLELKSAGGRGHTVKVRHPYPPGDRAILTSDGHSFLHEHGLDRGLITALRPTLITTYRRTTLLGNGFRCTLDGDLRCADTAGCDVRLSGKILVESKSAGGPTAFDRALWSRGVRPLPISKYCTGLAALHPELPSNKWHRTLGRHFDVTAGGDGPQCCLLGSGRS